MTEAGRLVTRRRLIELSGAGYLGLNLGGLWRAEAEPNRIALPLKPLRACILIFYYGGPSHLDTFDLKPSAPSEVRGEFKPRATSVPGIQICEHLPHLSRWMHKVALIRSMTHSARLHDSASIHTLTGRPLDGPDRELFSPLPQFYPSYGSAVAYFQRQHEVPFAALPVAFRNVIEVPCQTGGILGSAYDPLQIEMQLTERRYQIETLQRASGVDPNRSEERRNLLQRLEGPADLKSRQLYDKAFRLLESDTVRKAMDLSQEPLRVRERYGFDADPVSVGEGGGGGNGAELGIGRQMRGQNLLLARRLVEAGVPFVNVYDFKQQGQNWDAHFRCAKQHKSFLLPQADRALAALLEDLEDRGLLESTLVVAMGEFGRTPKINAEAGRDHWPDCYSVLLAGGGIHGGTVHGASDRLGAFPARDPVTPGDLAATLFWRFGIDPATEIHDPTGRPHRLASGEPVRTLFS